MHTSCLSHAHTATPCLTRAHTSCLTHARAHTHTHTHAHTTTTTTTAAAAATPLTHTLGKPVPGDRLARLSAALDPSDGVVTVNIAYRLGGLGYMAMPELTAESQHGTSGNYGMLDQIAALEWIGVLRVGVGGPVYVCV